tara:strand:+ start:207 stop:311 length:105 start_codon:yes stop_codon:yes gene_type:complete
MEITKLAEMPACKTPRLAKINDKGTKNGKYSLNP